MTEHVEGDPCKFALWSGRTPSSDNKTVLKVSTAFCWAQDQGCGEAGKECGLLHLQLGQQTTEHRLGVEKQILS